VDAAPPTLDVGEPKHLGVFDPLRKMVFGTVSSHTIISHQSIALSSSDSKSLLTPLIYGESSDGVSIVELSKTRTSNFQSLLTPLIYGKKSNWVSIVELSKTTETTRGK
jgi:hypothetical protein